MFKRTAYLNAYPFSYWHSFILDTIKIFVLLS